MAFRQAQAKNHERYRMISKKVPREHHDSFGRLAHYIAAAKDQDEKLDCLWLVRRG